MNAPAGRLRLQPRSTILEFVGGDSATWPVGHRDLAQDVFLHDPPTPAELERAIDVIEGALGGSRLPRADRGELVVDDAQLRRMPGLGTANSRLTRDEVEALFQRLASRSLGTPVRGNELPPGRDLAAALVILRECLHHLGFSGVVSADS